jgi:hypothetical protein
MIYIVLADLIVAFHVAYVAFVLVGQLLIVAGLILRWGWIRNVWFRSLHVLAIVVVAAESLFDIMCPLTVWEDDLRELAGQTVEQGTFIGRLLDDLLFHPDIPYNHWGFTVAYVGFAVLVLATFVLVPPRRRRRRSPVQEAEAPVHGSAALSPSA